MVNREKGMVSGGRFFSWFFLEGGGQQGVSPLLLQHRVQLGVRMRALAQHWTASKAESNFFEENVEEQVSPVRRHREKVSSSKRNPMWRGVRAAVFKIKGSKVEKIKEFQCGRKFKRKMEAILKYKK